MMNKLDLGLSKLTAHHRTPVAQAEDQLAVTLNNLKNQVYGLLMSNNVLKSDSLRTSCQHIFELPAEGRADYITTVWGPLYSGKVEYLLKQVETIEKEMNK